LVYSKVRPRDPKPVKARYCAQKLRHVLRVRSHQATSDHENSGVHGDTYIVSKRDVDFFHTNGYVHLPGVMSGAEMAAEIDPVYEQFMRGEVVPAGKDLCDMSGAAGRSPPEFTVFNAMLPRTYFPQWQGNLFERRCQAVADQLQGGAMTVDYDQILAKRPHSPDAIFAWHQDLAYWPPFTKETETATCWLAVDDSTRDNGCMRFVPGSHREPELREHKPVRLAGTRLDQDSSHALCAQVDEKNENVVYTEILRGDITVHNERVVHGSGPNDSAGWRRAYVLAFRKATTVAEERRHGFTHSHNDSFSWDEFHTWSERSKRQN